MPATLLLVATGEGKAAPIAAAVEGPLTAMCPASVLQLHPHATVVLDDAAASQLQLADYYRAVYAGKPVVAVAVRFRHLGADRVGIRDGSRPETDRAQMGDGR